MKRIVFSLLIGLLALTAPAQSYWGVRVGYDANLPGDFKAGDNSYEMFKNGSGFFAGAVYNHPIVAGLYIEPGAGLFYDSYKYSDLTISGQDGMEDIFNPKVKKFGLRIPVRLGYYFDIFPSAGGVSVYTGPQFDIGLSGKLGISSQESQEYDIERNIYNDFYGFRRVGMSWTVGANIYVGNWVVDISGAFGLTDMQKGAVSFHENRVSIGLGYNF